MFFDILFIFSLALSMIEKAQARVKASDQ